MNRRQKNLLKKHAEHFAVMAMFVRESGDAELAELRDACATASGTNCGWDTHEAAQYLLREARSEILQRQRRAALSLYPMPPEREQGESK